MILDENYKKELEEAALLPDYIPPLEDDDKEEVAVFAITTMIPFWRVIIYATLHEKMMFEAIMNEVLSAQMPDYFNERLDAKQLFRALCMVDGDCLRYILDKLDGADSVYNRLLNSVNDNNEAGFNEIICDGVTDTRPIVKICNCLRLLYEFYDGVDELNKNFKQLEEAENSSDDDFERLLGAYFDKVLYKVKIVLSGVDYTDETHKVINKIFKTLKDFVDDLFKNIDTEVSPQKAIINEVNNGLAEFKLPPLSQDYVTFFYGIMLYMYFYMRDGFELKTSSYTLEVLSGIILTPQQKDIWSKYDTSDNAHKEFESILDEMMDKVMPQQDPTLQSTEHPNEIEASVGKTLIDKPVSNEVPTLHNHGANDEPLYPDSKYGFIPEDFFSSQTDHKHPDEHFELEDEIIQQGEEQFVGFINYIADHGYIENNNKTKAIFAYVLSGKMKPSEEIVEPITWYGRDNSPKELLYIIRYCVARDGNKNYPKMKRLFDGPQWPEKGYSTRADDAHTDFIKSLHGMYEICGLKYLKAK